MTTQLTATEVKARLLAILDEVSAGGTFEITKRGKVVARLVPPAGHADWRGSLKGIAVSAASEDELFSTGLTWDVE